jgi:hypothetical protein
MPMGHVDYCLSSVITLRVSFQWGFAKTSPVHQQHRAGYLRLSKLEVD